MVHCYFVFRIFSDIETVDDEPAFPLSRQVIMAELPTRMSVDARPVDAKEEELAEMKGVSDELKEDGGKRTRASLMSKADELVGGGGGGGGGGGDDADANKMGLHFRNNGIEIKVLESPDHLAGNIDVVNIQVSTGGRFLTVVDENGTLKMETSKSSDKFEERFDFDMVEILPRKRINEHGPKCRRWTFKHRQSQRYLKVRKVDEKWEIVADSSDSPDKSIHTPSSPCSLRALVAIFRTLGIRRRGGSTNTLSTSTCTSGSSNVDGGTSDGNGHRYSTDTDVHGGPPAATVPCPSPIGAALVPGPCSHFKVGKGSGDSVALIPLVFEIEEQEEWCVTCDEAGNVSVERVDKLKCEGKTKFQYHVKLCKTA
jgi:hypothetical protein